MIAERSARSNIALSLASKVVSMGVAVLSVPVLLQLLSQEDYGTWVTLTSLLAWVAMLDLGVGNSLRNSVGGMVDDAEAATVQREFIAFFRLLALVGVLACASLAAASLWFPLLARNRTIAFSLYLPVLLLLPLLLGGSVLLGARAVGVQSLLQSAGSWLFFGFIVVLHWTRGHAALIELAAAWSGFYALCLVAIFLLALRHLHVRPAQLLSRPEGAIPPGRLKVGLSFLVLQLSSLALYSLGNTIIYQSLGSAEVARYDVLNKIFQVGLSFFTIVIGVSWAEISRLRALQDFAALRILYRRTLALALGFSACAIAAAVVAPDLVRAWTGGRIEVTAAEATTIAALVSIQALAYVGAVFMNAFEQIRLQVVLSWVSIAAMLPLAHLLLAAGHGIRAVPLAASALTLLPLVLCNAKALALIAQQTDRTPDAAVPLPPSSVESR